MHKGALNMQRLRLLLQHIMQDVLRRMCCHRYLPGLKKIYQPSWVINNFMLQAVCILLST